jgi:hypothetical protein
MSNITLHIDLGQDTVTTTSPTQVVSRNTRELGRFIPRIDVNQTIELRSRPQNNTFSVKLIDNLTNLVSTLNYKYIIQLQFEKIE